MVFQQHRYFPRSGSRLRVEERRYGISIRGQWGFETVSGSLPLTLIQRVDLERKSVRQAKLDGWPAGPLARFDSRVNRVAERCIRKNSAGFYAKCYGLRRDGKSRGKQDEDSCHGTG